MIGPGVGTIDGFVDTPICGKDPLDGGCEGPVTGSSIPPSVGCGPSKLDVELCYILHNGPTYASRRVYYTGRSAGGSSVGRDITATAAE